MRIIYHLGAHCTDEERLVRCLLKNRAALAEQQILVPAPTRYRRLMRDTAVQLKGATASPETEAMLREQILEDHSPERLILSWDSFLSFPQWALRGTLYGFAGDRIRAFTQLFPNCDAEFHLALRNPATLLPALLQKQKDKSYDDFVQGCDLMQLRWSDVVYQILAQNPGVPLVLWCDEDTPLIWPEVLQAVSGHDDSLTLSDTDELLSQIMTADGHRRMRNYLTAHPPASVVQRRKIVAAFLDKFALKDRIEIALDMPDWTAEMVAQMTAQYHADVAAIKQIPGVSFIAA